MNVARVIRNRDHQARAKSGCLSGLSHRVPIHSPAVIAGGFILQPLVRQDEREQQHRADREDRRDDEQDHHLVGEDLGEIGAAEDADVLGDPQQGRHAAALELGHLVGDGGDERGQRRVRAELGQAPAGRDDRARSDPGR